MLKHVNRDNLCCEAIVRRVQNGELLLVCQEGDIWEPAPLNRVYCYHSKDDGETWSPRHSIVDEDGRAVYCTEISVVGDTVLAYLTFHNGAFLNFECSIYESYDNGYTFKKKCDFPLDGFTFPRGLIKLSSGGYLLPYQNYPVSKLRDRELCASFNPMKIWNAGCEGCLNGAIFSQDGINLGEIYKPVILKHSLDGVWRWVWSEPTIIEANNGDIIMLLRYDRTGYLYKSVSHDKGRTFSEPEKTDIPNPSNKPKLLKTEDGRIVLVNTPNEKFGMPNRTPLEAWISDDDMKTFSKKVMLLDFPGWISYPDGFIEGNTLYLSFELNRHDLYFLKAEL